MLALQKTGEKVVVPTPQEVMAITDTLLFRTPGSSSTPS